MSYTDLETFNVRKLGRKFLDFRANVRSMLSSGQAMPGCRDPSIQDQETLSNLKEKQNAILYENRQKSEERRSIGQDSVTDANKSTENIQDLVIDERPYLEETDQMTAKRRKADRGIILISDNNLGIEPLKTTGGMSPATTGS